MGLVEHLRVQPSYRSTAATAARPQRVVGVLRKYQVMGTKTGVNERELPRLGIVHGQLPAARFEREQNRRRMARPFFAERWIVTRANPGGDPDSSLFIKHGIVDVGLAVPNGFISPIRRRRRRLIVAARWRLRVTDWHADSVRCGAHWVEDRQIVNAKFCGAVNCSVGVQCGIALVGGNFIVQIGLRVCPVPLGNDHVSFGTLRSRGHGRQLSGRNPVGPISEHGQCSLWP